MNINKIIGLSAVTICMALSASATLITFQSSPYQNGVGGEFSLTPSGSPGLSLSGYGALSSDVGGKAGSFQSFCLEYNEHISYGGTYIVAEINPDAVEGGVSGGSDPLSLGTGWLYSQFANGTLEDYFTGDRQVNAGQLQIAFWTLEEEHGLTYTAGVNGYLDAAVAAFGTFEAAHENGASQYGVYALNLTDGNGNRVQDQLWYDGSTRVPDGGLTVMMLGSVMAGLAVLLRRSHKA